MSGPRLLFKIFSTVFVAHIVMSTYLHFTREDHLDDQAYDEFGVHLSASTWKSAERWETEAMPTLLMVCGLEKSGATYVRQLLLDNLEIAPLDTHDNDHHNEPAMMLLREAAGISSDNMIPRNDPAYLMREH